MANCPCKLRGIVILLLASSLGLFTARSFAIRAYKPFRSSKLSITRRSNLSVLVFIVRAQPAP